jgi:hypothetical protein
MDKERVKQLQNDLWTSTTRPGKAPPKAVLDAIRALGQLCNEIERLKVRI